ncbi:hypothetical protein Tco_1234170 [Tanacetum coccineum]
MSTPAYFDSKIISQTIRAQSSRVPALLPDDPYVVVRQAHLVNTDTESGPVEDLRETESHTPTTVDIESEPEEAPLKTKEFEASEPSDTRITSLHSSTSLDYTAPLSPDNPFTQTSPTLTPTRVLFHRRTARMAVRIQPTLSSGMSVQIAEAAAFGTSELVEDSEDESLDSDTEREGLEDEGHVSEDEGPGLEEEGEVVPEGQQQAVLAEDTTMDEPLGLSYGALRRHELVVGEGEMPNPEDGRVYTDIPTYVPPVAPVQTRPSPEWSSGSFLVSPSSPAVPTLVASPVTTSAATIAVDEDEFLESYRFRSLEREQDRATVTFTAIWRPILALEAWVGQTDAQRAALWHAICDTQRENHDLRM